MDKKAPELEQAQILLAHKQPDRIKQVSNCLGQLYDCEVRLTVTESVDDTIRELDSARFDLVLCDRRLLTVKLIEQFNRLRSRGETAATVLLCNEADDQARHTGRAISAMDAIPLSVLNEEALSRYIQIALRLGSTLRQDNQANQVLDAVGTFGDVFFYRARIDHDSGDMIMDWLSSSFADLTGYPSRDFLGMSGGMKNLVTDDDLPQFNNWLENIKNNHRAVGEHRIHDHLGRERWLETKGQPIWNSELQSVTGVLGRARDVTQKRQSELRMEGLSKHQTLLAEFGQVCTDAVDPQDIIRSVSKLVAKATGCDICGIFQRNKKQFALLGSYGWKLNAPSDRFLHSEISNELSFTLTRQEAVIIGNVTQEQRFTPSHILMANGAKTGICLPILGKETQGVLCAYSRSELSPSQDDLLFLHTLADMLASHMRQKKTQKKNIAAAPADDTTNHSRAIEEACQLLLNAPRWQRSTENALQRIGQSYSASHAMLFDMEVDEKALNLLGLRYEWSEPGQINYSNKARAKYFDFKSLGLTEVEDDIAAGDLVLLEESDAKELFEIFHCEQVAISPIIIEGTWWGFLMLTSSTSTWEDDELSSLNMVSSVLASIIQRQRIEGRMGEVIEGTAATTGEDFYSSLAQHMAKALQADYCHIARINESKDEVNVIANWELDQLGKNFNYELMGSPCVRILEGDLVYYPEDTCSLYPANDWLTEHGINGYLAAPMLNRDGTVYGYLSIMRCRPMDVSENDLRVVRLFAGRAAAEVERELMEQENRRLASMPEDSPSPIMSCAANGKPQYINPACKRLAAELKLNKLADILPNNHAKLVTQAIANPGTAINAELSLEQRTLEWFYHAQTESSQVQLYAVDISQHREEENQLRQDAFHDHLTGLPNRGFFKNLISHSLEKSSQNSYYNFAILFLDLDRFKVINDSLGHDAGDQLLEVVATRLVDNIRPGDYVARFGGDEFAVLLDGISDVHAATDIASKLQRELNQPIQLGNHESVTSASIGIAYSDRDYQHIEDMIRDADSAMYHAKNNGKAQHAVFNSDMHEQAMYTLKLETDLRKSIENKELRIHYQPIIDISRDKLVGFEALVRWQHPKRGLMFPDDFIPLAEETGFVRELDRWMLDHATAQLQDWRGSIEDAEDLSMSINLSGLHFDNMEILSHIGNLLSGNDLSGHLKLELTESVLMQNSGRSLEMFNILHARGLSISIDDFGVGYSSLSRLKRLPIDTLKIDRSFVQHMQNDQASLDIIRAIIDLSYNLKMEVVAEGVETAQQYKLLKRLGCHYAQGYYLSRPIPVEKATEFIKQPIQLPSK